MTQYTLTTETIEDTETEKAIIRGAKLTEHGLVLKLTFTNGSLIAVFNDHTKVWDLINSTGAESPEELAGKEVLAHMDGVRLVGLSLA